MKTLNNYIIEKLRINKNTDLGDKYNEGDTCLMISYIGAGDTHISLDIMKILKIDGDKLYYDFKTSFAHVMGRKPGPESNIIKDKSEYWYSGDTRLLIEMIIPHYESLDVINEIEKNGNKYKFFKKLGYVPDDINSDINDEFNVMKSGNQFDFVLFTKDDINKLKKEL